MVRAALPQQEAAILERLIQTGFRDLAPEFSRRLLAIELPDSDINRLHELGAKARAGKLTVEEDAELEAYLRVGHVLNVLKVQARAHLGRAEKKRTARKLNGQKS